MLTHRQALAQPLLSADEEVELVGRWRERGDEAARDRLIRTHMRLCYNVAARYVSNEEHVRDLAQEGVFGLMKAVERFDPRRGTRFATYARWWVMTHVSQAVSRIAAVVDVPPRVFLDARGARSEDDGTALAARQAARGEVPLDAPVGDGGRGALVDLVPCKRPDPEAAAAETERSALFRRAVSEGLARAVTPREAEIVRRRQLSPSPDTLERIAVELGLSRERVRQIEAAALAKLRRHLVNSGFPRGSLRV